MSPDPAQARHDIAKPIPGAAMNHRLSFLPAFPSRLTRPWRLLAATALVLAATTQSASAREPYPNRPIKIVVGFSAGGSTDVIARLVAKGMSEQLGQPVIVENRAGAGGGIALESVAKAAPDGYTLLLGTVSSIAVNAALYAKLPFDVDKDIQPITQLVSFPNLLIINPKLPVKTVQELIDYVKKNDGKVNYASSGLGTSSHLSVVMFEQAIGVKMTHVPYKSTGDVVNSMLGGNVDIAIDSMTTVWPHAKQGTVRALGVSTPKRSASAPEVPAIGETIKGFEATAWQGLFAPAGTPMPVVEKIAAEAKRIWGLPAVKEQLMNAGADSALSESPDAFVTFTRAQRAKWAEVVKAAGVKIE
jgi:tripartite-type tricarboxylate transporter receptor subunit TctC